MTQIQAWESIRQLLPKSFMMISWKTWPLDCSGSWSGSCELIMGDNSKTEQGSNGSW